MERCKWGEGVSVKPDGTHDLDPCEYEVVETYRNVTIEVLRCKKCGHIELAWRRQENTEVLEEM